MRQASGELVIATPGQGLHDCTDPVLRWVAGTGIATGLLTLFVRHTSASLLIQENAAPAARRDLERYFAALAPESGTYEHDDEGPDDMPPTCAPRSRQRACRSRSPAVDQCWGRGRGCMCSNTARARIGGGWRCI